MAGREDSKPLAPAAASPAAASPAAARDPERLPAMRELLRRRRIICCSCCVATIVVIGILILILALTVFKVKDPQIWMNSITIDSLRIETSLAPASATVNISATADISVKNPNAATFKFGNSITSVVYRGDTVGVALLPAGKARARRTMHANVTLVVLADQLAGNGSLVADLSAGNVPVSTHTNLGGKVRILNIFNKHVDVVMNCDIVIAVVNQSVISQICEKKVKL